MSATQREARRLFFGSINGDEGPLIPTEPSVWIRGRSKNPHASPAGRKRGRALPTPPRSLPEHIKIQAEVSGMVGRWHLWEV